MIILIDIDEVLADFEGRLKSIWQEKYPHTPLFINGVRDSFYVGLSETHGKAELVGKIIHTPGFFEQLKPITGSQGAVARMQELGHEVYLVTSAGVTYPKAASEKYGWVAEHYGQSMLENLIITPAKHLIKGDLLIDDRPKLKHEDKASWEHVLYDRSYNKEVTGRRRITWEDWSEVLTELL